MNPITKQCVTCGAPFETRSKSQNREKYCSLRCKDHDRKPRVGLAGYQQEKVCETCGSRFLTRTKNPARERFCRKPCAAKFWNKATYAKKRPAMPPKRLCEVCGREFQPQRRRPEAKTCSIRCNQVRQDRLRKTARTLVRDVSPQVCHGCGALFTPHPKAGGRQKYCSPQCPGRKWRSMWTPSEAARHKRRRLNGNWGKVIERADGCCEQCGQAGKVYVHHRDGSGNTPTPNHALENLMVLCPMCHNQIHQIDYRVIDGTVYVTGKIFDLFGIETVQVLRE